MRWAWSFRRRTSGKDWLISCTLPTSGADISKRVVGAPALVGGLVLAHSLKAVALCLNILLCLITLWRVARWNKRGYTFRQRETAFAPALVGGLLLALGVVLPPDHPHVLGHRVTVVPSRGHRRHSVAALCISVVVPYPKHKGRR
jgi:hypothetical protein